MSDMNTWQEDPNGGLSTDSYYYDDGYDDDYFDQYEDDEWDDDDPYYDDDEPEGIAWEDLPLPYRIRANIGYWYAVKVRNPWTTLLVRLRLDRCPGCHKMYRFSGDHSNCPLPF
jgi:hypothetical protein